MRKNEKSLQDIRLEFDVFRESGKRKQERIGEYSKSK